jgi:hypothetical protein
MEAKLDKLLMGRKELDIGTVPVDFVVLPEEEEGETAAVNAPSCFAIDTCDMEEGEDSTATSQEDYVFKEHHLDNIHLRYYGYRLDKSEEGRHMALEKAFKIEKSGNWEKILNHLYALWTVWQGRKYEDVLRGDICWVEEKYF